MKKALKYFMLALLIVPCALAFTACGGTKQMSAANVAKYAYNVSKQYAKDNNYDEYQDYSFTKKVNTTRNYQEQISYKENATDETEKTELKDHKTITDSQLTLTRKGKGKNVVVKISLKQSVTEIKPTQKEDLTLTGKDTQTTETTTQTWLFGRVGTAEEGTYYILVEDKITTSSIVDGVAQTEGLEEPVTTKYYHAFDAEADFKETLDKLFLAVDSHNDNKVNDPATNLLNSLSAEYDSLSKVEKKSGVEVEGKFVEFEGEGLATTTESAKFSNNRVNSYKSTKEIEGIDMGGTAYTEKTTVETTWTYSADALTMPTEVADYDEALTSEQLLDDLWGFNSPILNLSSGD